MIEEVSPFVNKARKLKEERFSDVSEIYKDFLFT